MAGITIRRQDTGAVILRLTDRITRVMGTLVVPSTSGSFSIPQTDGTPWFFLRTPAGADSNNLNITLSGWTITWSSLSVNAQIVYGVY